MIGSLDLNVGAVLPAEDLVGKLPQVRRGGGTRRRCDNVPPSPLPRPPLAPSQLDYNVQQQAWSTEVT